MESPHGEFSVGGHGFAPWAVMDDRNGAKGIGMTPSTLAKLIVANDKYHGQDIYLYACSSGEEEGYSSYAELLAEELSKLGYPNVIVWAPTKTATVTGYRIPKTDIILFPSVSVKNGGKFKPFRAEE